MGRYAFQLHVRAGKENEYDKRHESVWPELMNDLRDAGVREYSIFRRGQMLFLYLKVDDFDQFLERMKRSVANQKWQAMMSDFFEPVADLKAGENFAMMREVFFMSGIEDLGPSSRDSDSPMA